MRNFNWILLSLLLIGLLQASPADELVVGVAGSPPFVQGEGDSLDGLSLRIWQALAQEQSLEYSYQTYPTVAAGIDALKTGKIEVLVGPISITSDRASKVAFTQPYFDSGLGILSHDKELTFFDKMRPFLSANFFYGVAFLLGLLGLVGLLIWLCEREDNEEQFPQDATGLFAGMWFAIVTMTTVGYGDKAPNTVPGRLVTSVWMLIATISFSTLTAGIATALTLSSLGSAEITSAEAAKHFGSTPLQCTDLKQAVDYLTAHNVDAVVFDHPALEYYLQKHPGMQLRLARSTFESQNYGFALAQDSPRVHEFNVALLDLAEKGDLKIIEDLWLAEASQ